jgi:hypothetical protein
MQCKQHNEYCYGEIEVTKYGNVCWYHYWLYTRCDKHDDKRNDDDGYGLQLYDNVMFAEVDE